VVFADDSARLRLNAIIHPLIQRTIADRCAKLAEEGQSVVLIDAALLAEEGERDAWLDGLIVVSCPRDVRLRRLVEQRGLSRAEAERRIEAQGDPDRKLAFADWIIKNDGTLKVLQQRVDEIARELDAYAQ
jgi:dephospho-CoA kinase